MKGYNSSLTAYLPEIKKDDLTSDDAFAIFACNIANIDGFFGESLAI